MIAFLQFWFLFYVCVIVPRGSLRGRKAMDGEAALPSRTRVYANAMFTTTLLGLLALLTARYAWIELFPRRAITGRDVLIGLVALVVRLAVALWRIRSGAIRANRAAVFLAPRTSRERWLGLVLVILAAVFEECAYRGVAWTILTRFTGNLWLAAVLASIAFALGHLVQGRKAVLLIVAYALIDHAVVYLTGSLYVAMAAHFLYDTIVGLAIARWIREPSGSPQPALPDPSV